jgi:hypothetical protein
MIRRSWPSPIAWAAAPTNDPVHRADWTAMDALPPALRFPNAADLAELDLLIRRTMRGER